MGPRCRLSSNTHLRGMNQEQLASLAPEEKAVLNIPAYL